MALRFPLENPFALSAKIAKIQWLTVNLWLRHEVGYDKTTAKHTKFLAENIVSYRVSLSSAALKGRDPPRSQHKGIGFRLIIYICRAVEIPILNAMLLPVIASFNGSFKWHGVK